MNIQSGLDSGMGEWRRQDVDVDFVTVTLTDLIVYRKTDKCRRLAWPQMTHIRLVHLYQTFKVYCVKDAKNAGGDARMVSPAWSNLETGLVKAFTPAPPGSSIAPDRLGQGTYVGLVQEVTPASSNKSPAVDA